MLLGLVLEAVYVAALIVPFGLLRWIGQPGQDLGSITGGTPHSAFTFAATSVSLCVLSWLAYRSALVAEARASTVVVFAFAVLFALTMIWIYPIDALDVFDYAMQGRILGVFGDNPYVNLPAQYPGDPFFASVGWKQFPSVYGPGWLYLAALIGRVAGESQLVAVVGLKCMAAASSLVCTWSVFKLVQRYTPVRAPAAALLFGWNPLVVLMVGSGHNDALMMALVLSGLVCAEHQRRGLGLWLMGLSLAVKLAALPILPALAIGQVWKRARYAALAATAGLVATLIALHAPLWPGWEHFGPVVREQQQLFSATPLGLINEVWLQAGGGHAATDKVYAAGYALLLALTVHAMWRARAGALVAIRAVHDALFWMIFLALPWWQPWYLVWLACFAAIDDRPWAPRLSWVVALAGLVSLVDRFYLTQRWLPVSSVEHYTHTLALVYLPPVCIALAVLARSRTGIAGKVRRRSLQR